MWLNVFYVLQFTLDIFLFNPLVHLSELFFMWLFRCFLDLFSLCHIVSGWERKAAFCGGRCHAQTGNCNNQFSGDISTGFPAGPWNKNSSWWWRDHFLTRTCWTLMKQWRFPQRGPGWSQRQTMTDQEEKRTPQTIAQGTASSWVNTGTDLLSLVIIYILDINFNVC